MNSYESILASMKEKYTELSGNNIPDGSDIDIRMKLLAGEIFSGEAHLDFLKRQMFAKTATGEFLDNHAEDRGLSRKQAVKSSGLVAFRVNEARSEDIIIPSGTIVSTSGSSSIRFITDSTEVLAAGSVRKSVHCIAERAGADGNVSAGTIDVMVSSVIGIDNIINTGAFSGGADRESDDELRERILDTYRNVSNGCNAAYYKKLAQNVDGVYSVKVVPRARGAGTVDVNICGQGEMVSNTAVARVQALLNENRELNVDVRANAATEVIVSFGVNIMVRDGYSFRDVKTRLTSAVRDYVLSLGVGGDVVESQLGGVIASVEGVYDYIFMFGYDSSYSVADDEFAVFSSITIGELST